MHPNHEENLEDRPQVWLRPSQIKIRYPLPLDPAMLWIDLLRHSHMRVPGRLAVETIICLAENKVPHDVFAGLLRDGLQSLVADLTVFEGQDAMFKLWYNIAKHKSVIAARVAREAHGEARVRGFGEQKEEDPETDTDVEDGDDVDDFSNPLLQRSSAWWTDQISGCPSSLEETTMVLLDAGFKPQSCACLKEKLKKVVESCIDTYISRYKLEVPMSCMGLLVPGMIL
jgi:RNA-dependent RNA polymerase